MNQIQELRNKIAEAEDQLLNLRAEYFKLCFASLGIEPKTKDDVFSAILTVNELVEFAKTTIDKFPEYHP